MRNLDYPAWAKHSYWTFATCQNFANVVCGIIYIDYIGNMGD